MRQTPMRDHGRLYAIDLSGGQYPVAFAAPECAERITCTGWRMPVTNSFVDSFEGLVEGR